MSAIVTDVPEWIINNTPYFAPPVCNKLLHQDGQLKVFFVGGPNSRKDFHIEEGEELFYMIKGDMCLRVLEQGQFRDIHIREGDVFLLPSKIPHSPQRIADTVGLVIERERKLDELDGLRYFIDNSNEVLFDSWFYCDDLGPRLGKVIEDFFQSEEHRTGKPSKAIAPAPYDVDNVRKLENPFSLSNWIIDHEKVLNCEKTSRQSLFGDRFKSEIDTLGVGIHQGERHGVETFLWQLEGSSKLTVNGTSKNLKQWTSALIPCGQRWELESGKGCFTLQVVMSP